MSEKYYRSMQDARGALALDTGFDPFLCGGWGRCTKAKLAEAGYVVDAIRAAQQAEQAKARRESAEREYQQREAGQREWSARPRTQKYAAAAKLIGGGNLRMVEIGDDLAHVMAPSGAVAVVELSDGIFVARLPRENERIFV